MDIELVLQRLVKREGMFVDEVTKRRGTAQFVATYREREGSNDKLVLLINAPQSTIRELHVDRDGHVFLRPEVLNTFRVDRGMLGDAIEAFNAQGGAMLIDAMVL